MRLSLGLAIVTTLLMSAAACADEASEPAAPPGELVIAGGGLSASNTEVWGAFIEAAKPDRPFVIVPSASGSPVQSAHAARDALVRHGVAPERIEIAELALLDDRSTDEVDESDWAENVNQAETIDLLGGAGALWFTGGDQSRTTRLLLSEDHQATPALKAIQAARSSGSPIGGTSAGAAIMSTPMITQGDPLTALIGSGRGEPLKMAPGLGFFGHGLVDQHFGERARLGRLVMALMSQVDTQSRLGFGVDEDTALILEGRDTVRVAGSGYVTVIDARRAELKALESGRTQITSLTLHLLAAGDAMELGQLRLVPASWKEATVGHEYVELPLPSGGGMALPGQALQDVIGEGLIDNATSTTVERISFDERGEGLAYIFTQLPQSEGFWGRGPNGEGRYAIANIRFDILPIRLSVETLK